MAKPGKFNGSVGGLGGVVYTYTNDQAGALICQYACVTAPNVIACTVKVNGVQVDKVYAGAGGSHSWWKDAGGPLIPEPLQPGSTIEVSMSGEGTFRADWYDTA
jgi:hypothetical protein